MTNKQYNIWGISAATGYQISIDGNLDSSTLSALKESIRDATNTLISQSFSKANPTSNNFYSIERVGDKVVYTIYRTNWRDSSARLSYDAISVVVNSNEKIVSPLSSLNTLMRTYVSQVSNKQSPNLENALASIPTERNSVKRSVSKKYHEGYFKYTSDTELSSVFHDSKDSLKNFNKVYFFSNLPYLENKIQNVKDYSEIPIVVINFNSKYHEIRVEGRMVRNLYTTDRQTINCFPGDEIIGYVRSKKGKIKQTPKIASKGEDIEFKKIVPQKPKDPIIIKNRKYQRDKWIKIGVAFFAALCLSVILILVIQDSLSPPTTIPLLKTDNKTECKVKFEHRVFISEGDTITDSEELLKCFNSDFIRIKDEEVSVRYNLSDGHDVIREKSGDNDWTEINNTNKLDKLLLKIQSADNKNVIKGVVESIKKVIHYERIKSENGLKLGKNYWKLDDSFSLSNKSSEGKNLKFKDYVKPLQDHEKLQEKLNKKLPASVYDKIVKYYEEQYDKQENQLTEEQKKFDKDKDGKLNEKEKENFDQTKYRERERERKREEREERKREERKNNNQETENNNQETENQEIEEEVVVCTAKGSNRINWKTRKALIELWDSDNDQKTKFENNRILSKKWKDRCEACGCSDCKEKLKTINSIIDTYYPE